MVNEAAKILITSPSTLGEIKTKVPSEIGNGLFQKKSDRNQFPSPPSVLIAQTAGDSQSQAIEDCALLSRPPLGFCAK